MKQLLRHIFLLVAMFIATFSVWAQTYSGDTWYSLYQPNAESKGTDTGGEIKNYTGIYTPSIGTIYFETKMSKSIIGQQPNDYSLDVSGKTVSVGSKQTSYVEKSASGFDKNITSIKFSYNYTVAKNLTRTVYIRNVKLPLATHILLSNGTTSDSKTFNPTKVGSSSENIKINLRSFLTNKTGTNGITIKSSNSVFRIVNADANNVLTWNVGANACASSNGNYGVDAKGGTLGDIDKYFFEIYFKPTEATEYNEKITISDGYSTATINVFGTGLKKDQNIIWSTECSADNVTMPIGQAIVNAATATSGGEVTYSSNNPEVIRVEGNKLIALKKGSAIITARQAGDDKVWNSCEDYKTFTVTDNKIQYIEWLDNFAHLRVDDGEVDLTATAKVLVNVLTNEVIDAPERTPLISYKSNDETIVSVQGKKLIIRGVEGETTITATLPATDGYESVSMSKPVRVLAKATGCDVLIPHTGASATGKLVWDATEGGSKNITIDLSRGIPEKLSFTYRGEVFGAEFTKILTGAIKVEASEDGNSWSLLRDEIKTKDDEFGDDILMTDLPTLSNKTNYIRFTRYDNDSWTSNYGTYVINNIEIAPARFIEVNNEKLVPRYQEETTIDFGDVFIGYSYEPKSFYLTYSDVQNISLKKNNSQICLSEEQIPIECGQFTPLGTSREIKITLNPATEGQINETITITDEAKTKTAKVIVKANVKRVTFEGQNATHTDWNTAANWNSGSRHGVPTANIPVDIAANAEISNGIYAEIKEICFKNNSTLHISSQAGLTVGNGGIINLATDGTITIDNTPQGAGFLKVDPNATNKPNGKVTIKYITKAYNSGVARDEIWQYMGAPGSDMQMSDADKTMIYHWNEQQGWLKMSNTNLQPFVGYAFTQNKAQEASFQIQATPIIPDKVQEIPLTVTSNGMRGSNLFVNSFLAPIDLATFDDKDFTDGVEQTFYLYNSGSWNQWQNQGGADNVMKHGVSPGQYYALSPKGAELMDPQYDQTTIPPMQGVYVVATKDGASIKLDYTKHVYAAEASNQAMRAPQRQDDNFKRVRLQVSGKNSGADRMYVIQHNECTSGYDNGYDAKNMPVASQVSIYTSEVEGQMEISVSDKIDSTYIGFRAGADSEYTLRITSVVGEYLYIKDLDNQTLISVYDGEEYTFSAEPNSVNDRRFLLLDQRSDDVSTDEPEVRVYVHDKMAHVLGAPIGSDMVIYTIGGVAITNYTIECTPSVVDLSSLPTGVYVLRINDKAFKCVCK